MSPIHFLVGLALFLIIKFGSSALVYESENATFDYYVFAQSWQPEFCAGHEAEEETLSRLHHHRLPGCHHPQAYWKSNFTIHGLWPENSDGSRPAACSNEPLDPAVIEKIGLDTLHMHWPDVKYSPDDPKYLSFWAHEWGKHGTCSGLNQLDYFQAALKVLELQGTPQILQEHVGQTIETENLRQALGGKARAILKCDHGDHLSQVFSCWTKDADTHQPSAAQDCEPAVLKEDTCLGEAVFVEALKEESIVPMET